VSIPARPRLIEHAFPLQQASIDSVHEKNVRQGHISTLHIWPARRPLAACRAALIATLLPDPDDEAERRALVERLGGRLVEKIQRKKLPSGRTEDKRTEQTMGGILHWGREDEAELRRFRQRIREAHGGRAPRVLDPFAGGGAIPLEAMRLGCEVTAVDLNPVAWMILKCTLEYPQRLHGERRALPDAFFRDRGFVEKYFGAHGLKGAALRTQLEKLGFGEQRGAQFDAFGTDVPREADVAWHLRGWARWVLREGRATLETLYPVIEGKPTVAYLWARTVRCKGCRASIPLLKTRWLCRKDDKRVVLHMRPNETRTGVEFSVETDVPHGCRGAAQRREHDRRIGGGTMSRSGATCPVCKVAIMTMEDIRVEGRAGQLGTLMTAVVVDGKSGKEYRAPTSREIAAAEMAKDLIPSLYDRVPYGKPEEPTPKGGSGASRAFSVDGYGFDRWSTLFTDRQLVALGVFLEKSRAAGEAMRAQGYPPDWVEAIVALLAMMLDRLANQGSSVARWNQGGEKIEGTFARFALPMLWDFAEVNPLGETSGGYLSALDWVALAVDHCLAAVSEAPSPRLACQSATQAMDGGDIDIVVTDPPYYDAIPYSDLMDFFYVWLRRSLAGLSPAIDAAFREALGPKWDAETGDGELIDDSSRFGGDGRRSKAAYEAGMARAFEACHRALRPEGRMVIVFAHKHPDAWETLVSAIIRAGFVVDASWPIQTERAARTRSLSSAALSSSVWLVCRRRPEASRPGWDTRVLEEMRGRIYTRLREFWDAGIRGPDFVWAATGPALEAYSQHPVVKKANEPGQLMSVPEFLRHVRRIVVDYVVGRVLTRDGNEAAVSGLDDVTTYYLLHRHDFGLGEAPIGPCILYAVSCGLSDAELCGSLDVLVRKGGGANGGAAEAGEAEEPDEFDDESEGGGSKVRLETWERRERKGLGYESAGGRPVPLIDQVHRLMHLWKAGDVHAVNAYIDERDLRHEPLFDPLLQALIELADKSERTSLERISNHVKALGQKAKGTRELFR
jgi:adenine-specific DNA methylase